MAAKPTFRRKVFETPNAKAVLFLVCPFGTKISLLRKTISSFQKDQYTVVAYDYSNNVLYKGEPPRLPQLVASIIADIKTVVKDFLSKGTTNFGFFGISLGGFILYNAVAEIPELKWGVFIAGGNAAKAIWKFRKPRKQFIKRGQSLTKLEQAWQQVQFPVFHTDLRNSNYVFVGSNRDHIVPLNRLDEHIADMRKAGANTRLIKVTGFGHNHTAIIGLIRSRKLLRIVAQ